MGQGRSGDHWRCPAPLQCWGPGSGQCQMSRGGSRSGLISSGGERHFLGSVSNSICISCGPAGRHLCQTRRTRDLEEGDGAEEGTRGRENLETGCFHLLAAGASAADTVGVWEAWRGWGRLGGGLPRGSVPDFLRGLCCCRKPKGFPCLASTTPIPTPTKSPGPLRTGLS